MVATRKDSCGSGELIKLSFEEYGVKDVKFEEVTIIQ